MSTANRIEELRQKFDENPRRYFAPLANEYRKAGDLAQAISLCREHLPKQPGHMSGYIVFGQALFEAKQLDEAREVFEQALALDPENLIALRHLGDIARDKNRPSLARRWYERVLDADPRNDDIAAQLMTLANMTTPRGGLPAVAEDAPAAAPAATTPAVMSAAPVVELPPARFTPRNFEPIDIDMPAARSMPTPSYPPRAIEVPPIPTPDSALRAIDEFPTTPISENARPVSEALNAFAAFDPSHALDEEIDVVGDIVASTVVPLQPTRAHAEPIADDLLPWNDVEEATTDDAHNEHVLASSASDSTESAADFEEGLVAPSWPDTNDLVARIETPVRFATPIASPVTDAAADAFGREESDAKPVERTSDEILASLPDRLFASGAFASIPSTSIQSLSGLDSAAATDERASHEAAASEVESMDLVDAFSSSTDVSSGVPATLASPVDVSFADISSALVSSAEDGSSAHADLSFEAAMIEFEQASDTNEPANAAESAEMFVAGNSADQRLDAIETGADEGASSLDEPEIVTVETPSVPSYKHESSVQMLYSFDDAESKPVERSSLDEEHALEAHVEVSAGGLATEPASTPALETPAQEDFEESEADSMAPFGMDAPEDLPWIAAVETPGHLGSGLGEPSLAEYEAAADDADIAEQFTHSFDGSFVDTQEYANVDASVAATIDVSVNEQTESQVEAAAGVEEDANDQAETSEVVEQVVVARQVIADEASFADVIDEEMFRASESSDDAVSDEPESFADFVSAAEDPEVEARRTPVFITPLSATPVSYISAIPTPATSTEALEEEDGAFSASSEVVAAIPPVAAPAIPIAASPTPAIGSAAFVTETMAELLVSQGFIARAVDVYEELVRRRPYDPVLTSRLAELREFVAAALAPVNPTPRSVTPVYSTPVGSTPVYEAPALVTTAHATPLHATPLHATPLHATPVYGTPVSVTPLGVPPVTPTPLSTTPLSATPISSSSVTPTPFNATPIAVPALNYNAELPQWRTARQRFSELAGRRVPRRTPPRATAAVDEPADGLSSLFGTAPSNAHDDSAARALADAFGPITEGGPSLFEPDMSVGAVGATPIGNAAVASQATPRSSRATGTDFSFDRFFPDPARPSSDGAEPAVTSGAASANAVDAAPAPQTGEDLAQFSAWLKGLANP